MSQTNAIALMAPIAVWTHRLSILIKRKLKKYIYLVKNLNFAECFIDDIYKKPFFKIRFGIPLTSLLISNPFKTYN